MGNRHGKNAVKENSETDEKPGSKQRENGRKKTDAVDTTAEESGQNEDTDGKKKSTHADGKKSKRNSKDDAAKRVSKQPTDGDDDGELGKRRRMGRLSRSFGAAAGETTRHSSVFPEYNAPAAASASRSPAETRLHHPRTAELKVYRSYSSLADEKKLQMYAGQPSLANVKVYRKNPETPLSYKQRAMSLPRGFDKTRDHLSLVDRSGGGRADSRDSLDRGGGGGGGTWTGKRMSAPATRSATLPRLYGNSGPTPTANYRVSKDDFPDTLAIQRKLKQFEKLLVRNILEKFSRLSPESQLNTVPIAIRLGTPNQLVTLRDYITDTGDSSTTGRLLLDDAASAAAATGDFVLCVPAAMFTGMAHFRRERSADRAAWPTLARDVVTCVAAEAATDIARMFEYQISLLTGDSSVSLLADHGADRILSFILHDLQTPRFDRNTLIQGAVRGNRVCYSPALTPLNPVYISVIVGQKELKWNLYEIFDRPGLRKDVMLVNDGVPAPGDGDLCPWKFYVSHSSEPMVYGYRGQLIEWDFVQGHFRVNGYDEASYSEEMSWRFDDFHRTYPPFKRVFGVRAMKRYYNEQVRPGIRQPLPLDRFLMRMVRGNAYARDAIQPVYRPLEPFALNDAEGMDWTVVEVPRVLLPRKTEGVDVQAPLSPSGEFAVFSPPLSDHDLRPSLDAKPHSPERTDQQQGYFSGDRSPPINPPPVSVENGRSRVSPYFRESAVQRYSPMQCRSPTLSQTFSSVETLNDGRKPPVSQYYSPGGTLRKIYSSPSEVEAEVETRLVAAREAPVPPHYSPGGTLRRSLPANGAPNVQSHSSEDTSSRSHSPGVDAVSVNQNHCTEVATSVNSSFSDPRFAGYTLVEEVVTENLIKASNV